MAPLPVDILLGIYLGLLTGIVPGLAAWSLGFLFKYFTGVSIPGFGVVVLGVALAGVSGGLLALADPTITQSSNGPTLVTAILVVTGLALYSHSKGDELGANFPKRISLSSLREQRLPRDVVELVGGRDEVRIRVVGDVADMEGYPPLTDDLRAELRAAEYTFPSDLRVAELEERFAERLRTEFDLGDVTVTIDERGRATVTAAPPFSGLSKRVPTGKRGVSVDALVPTGLARGDEVTLTTGDAAVDGTVISAKSSGAGAPSVAPPATDPEPATESGEDAESEAPPPARAPTTSGGDGRVTAAVSRADAETLVAADRARVVVNARGTRLEYELISLVRRAGKRFQRLTVRADGPLDGTTLGAADVRERYSVAVVAARTSMGWQLAPRGSVELTAGDELYAVGTREALDAFRGAVA